MAQYNNSLVPYKTCKNANLNKGRPGNPLVNKWAQVYLVDAQARLQKQLRGYNLTLEDVYAMQQMCAYEVLVPLTQLSLLRLT